MNYAGLALIVLGIALMVAELFVPSFGALGIGGIVAFVFGSVMLIDTDVPGFGDPAAADRRHRGRRRGRAARRDLAARCARGAAGRDRRARSCSARAGEVLEDFERRGLRARARRALARAQRTRRSRRASACASPRIDGLTLEVEPRTHRAETQ